MRLATYNVEWFTALFDDDNALDPSQAWSGRWNITRAAQLDALGRVFRDMDADGVMVIEAPDQSPRRDTVAALEAFAAHAGLRARKAVMGFANQTQQEIAFLFDPDVLQAEHAPAASADVPQFDQSFDIDLDLDDRPEPVRWSKPPLELAVRTAQGTDLRMIGVHAKSKAPHGAQDASEMMRINIANRRKQLAQCLWLRARVSEHLAKGHRLIVLGDFNDGPGLDRFEALFGRSGVEIVLGEGAQVPLYDPHARHPARPGAAQISTARFFDRHKDRFFNALLDFIMVSADLRPRGAWRILHPFDDPACLADPALQAALLTASDHFPVLLEIDI